MGHLDGAKVVNSDLTGTSIRRTRTSFIWAGPLPRRRVRNSASHITKLADPYNLTGYSNYGYQGGVETSTTGPTSVGGSEPINGSYLYTAAGYGILNPDATTYPNNQTANYTNLYRVPELPFTSFESLQYANVSGFNNQGTGVFFQPFTEFLDGSVNQHAAAATVDPLTGAVRLYVGDDQGIYTAIDQTTDTTGTGSIGETVDGQVLTNIGTNIFTYGSRNGNTAYRNST